MLLTGALLKNCTLVNWCSCIRTSKRTVESSRKEHDTEAMCIFASRAAGPVLMSLKPVLSKFNLIDFGGITPALGMCSETVDFYAYGISFQSMGIWADVRIHLQDQSLCWYNWEQNQAIGVYSLGSC